MQTNTRTNKKPGRCSDCGDTVDPGSGHLWWEPGPDDGGDVVGRTPAGWRVTHLDPSICQQTRERDIAERRERRQHKQRQRQQAQAEQQRAIEQQERAIEILLAESGCDTAAGYSWSGAILDHSTREPVSSVVLSQSANPALAGLSFGHTSWERCQTKDGVTVYLHSFGNACILHGPRDVVVRAWEMLAQPEGWPGYDDPAKMAGAYTPEECARWLDKLKIEQTLATPADQRRTLLDRPTAGWQAQAWLAGRADLLRAEKVI